MCNRFENKEGVAIYKKMDDKMWNDILKKNVEGMLNNYSSPNIKPTHIQPVLDNKDGWNITERSWGYWFPKALKPRFNIQSETLHKIKNSRELFEDSRAVVGATAFYEWITRTTEKGKEIKICMRISLPNHPEFYFPVITGEHMGQKNFIILTIEPNVVMSEIHDRMPVIFTPEVAKNFLNDKTENLLDYLIPFDDNLAMDISIAPDFMLNKDAIKYVTQEKERVQDEIDNPQLF